MGRYRSIQATLIEIALMAVSVLHLSHWRPGVAVVNYLI